MSKKKLAYFCLTFVFFIALFSIQRYHLLALIVGNYVVVVDQKTEVKDDSILSTFILRNLVNEDITLDGISSTCSCTTTNVPIVIPQKSQVEFQITSSKPGISSGGVYHVALFGGQLKQPILLTISL